MEKKSFKLSFGTVGSLYESTKPSLFYFRSGTVEYLYPFHHGDSRKNVWISTQSGLNRYDGVKMNVYRHKKGEAGTLGHDMVSCALEVEPGSVLVGMEYGVQMYSYDTDRFTDVPIIVAGGDTIHAHVISMTKLSFYLCLYGRIRTLSPV